MKTETLIHRLFAPVVLIAGLVPAIPASADVCIPDCDNTGVRSLVVAGTGLSSFAGQPVNVSFVSRPTNANFTYSIFDGDTGGFWDMGSGAAAELKYTLYADPLANCSGDVVLDTKLGSNMADNAWSDVSIANNAAAQSAPGGDFHYCLIIEPNVAPVTSNFESSFKVRTTVPDTSLALRPQHFAVVSPLRNLVAPDPQNPFGLNWDLDHELPVIYPDIATLGFPPDMQLLDQVVTNTIYDGTWKLHFLVNRPSPYIGTWNGDFDFGDSTCVDSGSGFPGAPNCDDDDPDTDNDAPPPWAVGESMEAALGSAPFDDSPFSLFRRTTQSGKPNLAMRIDDPSGVPYDFDNPAGDEEWEQGMITTDPTINPYPQLPIVANVADHVVGAPGDMLPVGIWTFNIEGLDLSNLNGVRFFHCVLGVDENGNPVATPIPCQTPGSCPAVDFDRDAFGNPLAAGTVISEQYASRGIHISVQSNGSHDIGMIFDTSNPTGGDTDLGSPNQGCGNPGPGVGAGGLPSNCINETGGVLDSPLGNVLIISEDGVASNPDDEGSGGVITFTFDDPRYVDVVRVVDMDGCQANASVTAYDVFDNVIKTVPIASLEDNEVENIVIDAQNVRRLVVDAPCSGAVAELCPNDSPVDNCSACDGKVTELTLRYNGATAAMITVTEKKQGTIFSSVVLPGDEFSLIGGDKNGTLGQTIDIFVNGVLDSAVHTSCSLEVGPGYVTPSGTFTSTAGSSRNGGPLCPVQNP